MTQTLAFLFVRDEEKWSQPNGVNANNPADDKL